MVKTETKGSIYAILSGFLYGFLGYFGIKAMNQHLSASVMLFWRFSIASIVILLLALSQLKCSSINRIILLKSFAVGVLFYGLSTWLYFLSCYHLSTGIAMVVFYTYPVLIMSINYFIYHDTIPRIYIVAMGIIFLGMCCLMDKETVDFQGLFLGILSAFFYASYLVASKRIKISPYISSLTVCMGCAFTSAVIALGEPSGLVIPNSYLAWMYLLGIGIIATAVPILLMLLSLQYISSEKASLLSILEPIFVVLFGVLLLDESLHLNSIIGMGLILFGASFTLISPKTCRNKIHALFHFKKTKLEHTL